MAASSTPPTSFWNSKVAQYDPSTKTLILYLLSFPSLAEALIFIKSLPPGLSHLVLRVAFASGAPASDTMRAAFWGQFLEAIRTTGFNPWVGAGWVWDVSAPANQVFPSAQEGLDRYLEYLNSGSRDPYYLALPDAQARDSYLSQIYQSLGPRQEGLTYLFNTGDFSPLSLMVTKIPAYGYLKQSAIPRYSSGRPLTQMDFLHERPPQIDLTGCFMDVWGALSLRGRYYMPVVRYAVGSEGGGYFLESSGEKKFCGTFYYLEPESPFFLRFQNYLRFRNKLEAFATLAKGFSYKLMEELTQDLWYAGDHALQVFARLQDQESEYLEWVGDPDNLDLQDQLGPTMDALKEFFIRGSRVYSPDGLRYLDPETNTDQDGHYLSVFYAYEDFLDQSLCQLMSRKGIEVLYLSGMVGKTRLVGEILDSRPRSLSFANIFQSQAL